MNLVDGLSGPVLIAFIAGVVAWPVVIRRAVRPYGDAGRAVLWHWTMIAWRVTLIVLVVLTFIGNRSSVADLTFAQVTRDAMLSEDRDRIILEMIRTAAGLLFVVAVWVTASRVKTLTSRSPTAP